MITCGATSNGGTREALILYRISIDIRVLQDLVIYNLKILNPMQRGIFASTVHAQNATSRAMQRLGLLQHEIEGSDNFWNNINTPHANTVALWVLH